MKLERVATHIGMIGFFVSLVTVISLYITFFWEYFREDLAWDPDYWNTLINYIIIGITIIVMAVPEGLPLAVTLCLAFSVGKMAKENNQVRHLDACETMGGADNVCSDKTGTLT